MARVLPILLSVLTLLLTGCETRSASERRIDQNPEKFARASSSEKELIKKGDIREGMSADAVYLAWGRPDMVKAGSRDGRETERWAYFSSAAVPVSSLSYGNIYRSYYNRFGIHPRFGYGYGAGRGWTIQSGVDYRRYVSRTVEFVNGRVVAWERRNR